MIEPFAGAYRGKSVLLTGHTGFKGAWLSEWLLTLGAQLTGYSLASATHPALFDQLGLSARMRSIEGDIRDAARLRATMIGVQPDFVFHLAAQPLVRTSYSDPVGTFDVNVLGTVQVLDSLRSLTKPCAVVCVTTDKCYQNREWLYGYREEDRLGGHDPYSASKAAAEIVIASYRKSYFTEHPVKLASARAGNVVGGGDWASDRIVPDCIRALSTAQPILVRNRHATRPWQHVLDPLSGYLWLGARLAEAEDPSQRSTLNPQLSALAGAFNFGPSQDAVRTVAELVDNILRHWPGTWQDHTDPNAPHEAHSLQLATDKARALLHWSSAWSFGEAVAATVFWYRSAHENASVENIRALTCGQIQQFTETARAASIRWAVGSGS